MEILKQLIEQWPGHKATKMRPQGDVDIRGELGPGITI